MTGPSIGLQARLQLGAGRLGRGQAVLGPGQQLLDLRLAPFGGEGPALGVGAGLGRGGESFSQAPGFLERAAPLLAQLQDLGARGGPGRPGLDQLGIGALEGRLDLAQAPLGHPVGPPVVLVLGPRLRRSRGRGHLVGPTGGADQPQPRHPPEDRLVGGRGDPLPKGGVLVDDGADRVEGSFGEAGQADERAHRAGDLAPVTLPGHRPGQLQRRAYQQ